MKNTGVCMDALAFAAEKLRTNRKAHGHKKQKKSNKKQQRQHRKRRSTNHRSATAELNAPGDWTTVQRKARSTLKKT
ncbi:uncharacterized protein K452DRAFT_286340 [Aplosporella prunicola CBS 121167]|uniref:Uncharacterized protein n=1 Tax=Aplosporella prunicola CBS 121167 TaxID=1176127 RepID=A0A6A6BJR2_9PEZI|nr:uncharacterized protein K452DRAFT_286340 [Aplosporella prunicola CBS 121167]KAF2143524.1 hypothetical protein K452DRAFT_286340 [Aplosporella prunicola CBS 121167]